ncbi:MAG: hypothetical protein M4579_003363 [Chaenotheca gracillima]|nr:MAG: hypothetical protein M4579_003363 [Chaenotheca gracillima]
MRIRAPFAGAFIVLCLISAYLGFAKIEIKPVNDKVLHFVTFFILTNDRVFDPYDILANLVGSLCALGLCSWYHKRMLERKRQAKNYQAVPGEEDLELGEAGLGPQESGVTDGGPSLEEEVDNWDENVEDNWDEEEVAAASPSTAPIRSGSGAGIEHGKAELTNVEPIEDVEETKKRND